MRMMIVASTAALLAVQAVQAVPAQAATAYRFCSIVVQSQKTTYVGAVESTSVSDGANLKKMGIAAMDPANPDFAAFLRKAKASRIKAGYGGGCDYYADRAEAVKQRALFFDWPGMKSIAVD